MSGGGFPLTEFTLETVIRDGLGNLRANPNRLDDLLQRFKEAHFNTQYGQARIDQVKSYIADNQIKIVQAYSLQPSFIPCISIQMMGTEEFEPDQELGNYFLPIERDAPANLVVGPLTPYSYDPTTGKVTFDNIVDLSTVCPHFRITSLPGDISFKIKTPISNAYNDKYVTLEKGLDPTLDGLVGGSVNIDNGIACEAWTRGQIKLRETIRLGVHAKNDPHITKFLYYILYYIIKTRETSLITRGVHLNKGISGVLDRRDEYNSENIYSRFFDLSCLTYFTYEIDEAEIASCFDVNIKVNDPTSGSTNTVNLKSDDGN